MPQDDADSTDPMSLHGVIVETEGDGAICEMADCFVEEYTRLGFDAGRILRMFKTPGLAGPHLAYQILGEDVIRAFIAEHAERRGPHSRGTSADRSANGDIALPVIEQRIEGGSHVIGL